MAKAAQPAVKEPNVLVRLYRETVGELRKVTWPTWQEVRTLTTIVLVVIFSLAIVLGLFDYLFQELIRLLLQLV